MKKFIGIVGTNSDDSTNRSLLQFIQKHFADLAAIDLIEIKDIPMFNKPENMEVPSSVSDIAKQIEASDGVIISTPEYDHAVPASLMNALHWLSYGITPFLDKPVMITGASYGRLGSSRAQAHLRQILDAPELKARIMPSSEFHLSHSLNAFDGDGNLIKQVDELEELFNDFVVFVEVYNQFKAKKTVKKNEEVKECSKMKLVGIVGSNADFSYNRLLLHYIAKKFKHLFTLEVLEIKDLPLFNQSDDQTNSAPVQYISHKIMMADGVIIATPEHNHTIPASLKSALEWLSFNIHPLENKPVMIVGASHFTQGSSRAQLHLRQILDAPGVNAIVMPGNEFLLGDVKEAFDENNNLKNQGTIEFLGTCLENFVKFIDVVSVIQGPKPPLAPEDLFATGEVDTTIEGVDMYSEDWVEQAARKVNAVEGSTYVKLNRGILTVDQINYFLSSMPMELTYADDNNQFIYYNKTQERDDMLAARTHDQVGNPLAVCHPESAYKSVEWVIQQLRSGREDCIRVHVPKHVPEKYIIHNYQAIRDDDGNYKGINEMVLDFKPMLDWYLKQTGQRLVSNDNVDAVSSASVNGKVDGVSSASVKG